ncbi:GlsB/YeaQ/YmgE family stress response membrane protein [Duganella sp. PWIR1]
MGFIIWLIIGGVLGWLASIVMRTDGQQGLFLNVVVGIIGAVLGGLILAPMIGSGTINDGDYGVASLGVSFVGAIVLLAIVNLVFRGRAR